MNIGFFKSCIALLFMSFTISSCKSNEEKKLNTDSEPIAHKPYIIKSLNEAQRRFNSFMKNNSSDFRIVKWITQRQANAFSIEFTENIECTFYINKDSSIQNISLIVDVDKSKGIDQQLQNIVVGLIATTDTTLSPEKRNEFMYKLTSQKPNEEIEFIYNNIHYLSYKSDSITFLMKISDPSEIG